MRRIVLIVLLLPAAVPAAAQQRGNVEIGLVGKWTRLDPSFSDPPAAVTAWGASIRLGLFLSPHWEIEIDDAQNFAHASNFFVGYPRTTLNYYPHHLRLDYNRRLGRSSRCTWILGAGPAWNGYGEAPKGKPGFKGHDFGFQVLTGLRARLTRRLALRIDGSIDYIPSPNSGKPAIVNQFAGINAASPPDKNVDLGIQAGVSLILGHGR